MVTVVAPQMPKSLGGFFVYSHQYCTFTISNKKIRHYADIKIRLESVFFLRSINNRNALCINAMNMDRYSQATDKIRQTRYGDSPKFQMPFRRDEYWMGLPIYAHVYIKAHYDLVVNLDGLIEFVHFYILEYSETDNPHKMLSIESIVMPIFQAITGRKYSVNYFAAFGIE